MEINKKIILASKSPRRQLLLKQIGFEYEIQESGIKETFDFSKTPHENVLIISALKAKEVAKNINNGIIIGADTIVVLDGKIFGKPSDFKEACEMLKTLSGRTHEVYTGFTLLDRPSNLSLSDYEVTKVTFRELSEEEIIEYVNSDSPMDKAGAYGIQDDFGAVFIEKIEGCFYNVVGFPLSKFYKNFKMFIKQIK